MDFCWRDGVPSSESAHVQHSAQAPIDPSDDFFPADVCKKPEKNTPKRGARVHPIFFHLKSYFLCKLNCSIIDNRPTKSLGLILGIMHQLKLKINIDV